MRALLVVAVVPACWTGSVAEDGLRTTPVTPSPSHDALHVHLERTPCGGDCSVYSIDIDGRGHRARWTGSPEDGSPQRTVRITDADLRELERQLASSRFFERDERGMLPLKTECTSDGTTTTCSIGARISVCSDTSHAIITVTRGRRENTVDYDFCDDNPDLVDLSRLIERIARTRAAEP